MSHLWARGKEAAEKLAKDMKEKAGYAKSVAEEKVNKVKESLS